MRILLLLVGLVFSFSTFAQNLNSRGSGQPFNRKPTQIRSFIHYEHALKENKAGAISHAPSLAVQKLGRFKNASIYDFFSNGIQTSDSSKQIGLGMAYEFRFMLFKNSTVAYQPYIGLRSQVNVNQERFEDYNIQMARLNIGPTIGINYHVNRWFLMDLAFQYGMVEAWYQNNTSLEKSEHIAPHYNFNKLVVQLGFGWLLP